MFNTRAKVRNVSIAALAGVVMLVFNALLARGIGPKENFYYAAKSEIPAGIVITEDKLEKVIVKGEVPPKVVQNPKDVVGKIALVTIMQDEPIMTSMASDKPVRDKLQPNYVGIWLPADINSTGSVNIGATVSLYDASGNPIYGGQAYRVIDAVDVQGKNVENGVPAAVELAVPGEQADLIVQKSSSSHVRLVNNPWASVPVTNQPALSQRQESKEVTVPNANQQTNPANSPGSGNSSSPPGSNPPPVQPQQQGSGSGS